MVDTQGAPRRLTPTVVTVDAGAGVRVRFHALVVRAYREWETGTRGPAWLRCSAPDDPGVAPSQECA
ncbi:hypothetical protein [Actinophytocola oryzae]|uniref:Uncharacterized protein n=1 Tax=Actinophytocola oryzae TaxID=502181 RepID=A0A4R7VS09_9PSEU|nr:hypothetical protein [Actinophytocola oryzae]TDV52268.1 hypothetical protein CLV71_105400 [Actinophytocola oryzae]